MKKNKYHLIEKQTGKVIVSGEASVICAFIDRPSTCLYAYVQGGYTIHDKYICVCLGKIIEKQPKKKNVGRPPVDPKKPFTNELYQFKSVRCILHHNHEGTLIRTTFLPL